MSKIKTTEPVLRAEHVRALISKRHGFEGKSNGLTQEWALFFELRNGTGYAATDGTQYLDAFAMNTWPSKKLWRVAYEIKVSRADFLRELSKPQKRQWGMEISNEFWFVCGPGIAKKEEIPEGCGLLEVDAKGMKLKRVVVAKQREARPLNEVEIAAIARKSSDTEILQSLKWTYNGQELDSRALDELLNDRQDQVFQQRVDAAAQAKFEEASRLIENQLYRYALQIKAAGFPAPAWMENWKPGMPNSWDAKAWGQKLVLPTPDLQQLSTISGNMKSVQGQLKRALEEVLRAQESLAEVFRPAAEPVSSGTT